MNKIGNYMYLDEVVYSSELVLSELCFKYFVDRIDSVSLLSAKERRLYDNLKDGVQYIMSTKNFLHNTKLKEKVLTRSVEHIFNLDDDDITTLLENTDVADVQIDVSRMLTLIDTCKIVYDPSNRIEGLIMKLLEIRSRVTTDRIVTHEDFLKYIDKHTSDNIESQELVVLARLDIIEKYVDKCRIIIPNNIPYCFKRGIYGFVDCWDIN